MSEKTYSLAAPIRKTCDLFRLLAGLDAPLMQLTVVKDTLEEVFLRATTEE